MNITYEVYEVFSYADFLTAVYILAPIVTFLIGAVIGILVYYKIGKKYGVKTPEFLSKIGRIHIPLYLAIVLYIIFLIFRLWYAYYNSGTGNTTYTQTISGINCFYHCYLNPLFYIWAAAIIAATVLAVLSYKNKMNFAVTYIIIGVSFIVFYGFTAYGADMYAFYYAELKSHTFKWINNYCSPMCIIAGVAYIVCTVLQIFLKRKKKAVEPQPQE